jgi:ubiquinone/menaquinone biosynthesis C-methylase UbiE
MGMNKQFARNSKKQARGFLNKLLSLNSEDLLKWIHRSLNLNEGARVLDAAAGTGILSRYLAPYVNKVMSVDLSPDMIAVGIERNKEMNISNIEYS